MCGVPYHACDIYLNKLIEKGYKVAICEQMEDPKLAKGIVKREVIRIVTPGTNMSQAILDETRNNYLMCIFGYNDEYGVAVCDITTGEFRTCHISSGAKLYDEINKIAGLVHILLSESKTEKNLTNRAKFADTGITLLYEELRKKGANPRFMKAKMAGGAHMFNFNNSNNTLTIGEKNVKVCKETLFKLRIPIISSDVLGSCGRTIIFDTTTNKLKIKSVGKNEKFI